MEQEPEERRLIPAAAALGESAVLAVTGFGTALAGELMLADMEPRKAPALALATFFTVVCVEGAHERAMTAWRRLMNHEQ